MPTLEEYMENGLSAGTAWSLSIQDDEYARDQERSNKNGSEWAENNQRNFRSRLEALEHNH